MFRSLMVLSGIICMNVSLSAAGETAMSRGMSLLNEGMAACEQQASQQALEKLFEALRVFRHIPSPRQEAMTLAQIGMCYKTHYRHEKARAYLLQSLTIMTDRANADVRARLLNAIADVHRREGNFSEALSRYKQALHIVRESEGKRSLWLSIAQTHLGLGEFAKAFQAYQEALHLAKEAEDFQRIGILHHELGTLSMRTGNYEKALSYFQKAYTLLTEQDDTPNSLLALTGIGGIYEEWSTQKFREDSQESFYLKAYAVYQEILKIQTKPTKDRAVTLNNIGKLLDRMYWEQQNDLHHADVLKYYHEAREIAAQAGAKAIFAKILANTGEVHIHLSCYGEQGLHLKQAHTFLQQALTIQQEIGDRTNEWMTLSLLAWTYERQKRTGESLRTYYQAIDALETSAINDISMSVTRQALETYQRMILLLVQEQQFEQAFRVTERARARRFLHRLGNMEFEMRRGITPKLRERQQTLRARLAYIEEQMNEALNIPQHEQDEQHSKYLRNQLAAVRDEYEDVLTEIRLNHPEYASMISVNPLSLKDIQNMLDSRTTLLSYFVAPDITLAFLISKEQFHLKTIQIREEALKEQLIEILQVPETPASPIPRAFENVYETLITPVKPHLKTPRIGVIPHGLLHYIPFAALSDGTQYLNDEYVVFSLPAASILQFMSPQQQSEDHQTMLALGHSHALHLPPLIYAAPEACAVGRLYGNVPLLEQAATETALKEKAPAASLIHLAAHSQLNPSNPLFSRIWLAPDEQNDGVLEVHEVSTLDLRQTDLVVLSACDTQAGKLSLGDELVGLHRAFLYAGASSVVASLWPVNDRATGLFMTLFYLRLKQGGSTAEALQDARTITRRLYPHPYYWAAFVLTGAR